MRQPPWYTPAEARDLLIRFRYDLRKAQFRAFYAGKDWGAPSEMLVPYFDDLIDRTQAKIDRLGVAA